MFPDPRRPPQLTSGVDTIDCDWLTSKNCFVANTPYAVTDATADMAITLMLCALRGISAREANIKAGKWKQGMGLAEDPAGKTLGIFGMGKLGSDTHC